MLSSRYVWIVPALLWVVEIQLANSSNLYVLISQIPLVMSKLRDFQIKRKRNKTTKGRMYLKVLATIWGRALGKKEIFNTSDIICVTIQFSNHHNNEKDSKYRCTVKIKKKIRRKACIMPLISRAMVNGLSVFSLAFFPAPLTATFLLIKIKQHSSESVVYKKFFPKKLKIEKHQPTK